jgi:hypothetical protein
MDTDTTPERPSDLATMVVLPVGRPIATSDGPGALPAAGPRRVNAVAAFLRDLQAAGRPAATRRSYGMGLLS